ncbi:helix-turn-helix transcriptional regulator [Actinoplanes sp. NEAU-A12]|uniref:Helix-turn-helix transcriptional regulator n=1 Tax=Actinoplanes sandaracinus TaxID=3045177 RepID=A0ABT6WF22_9ACTN|nr:helix-turn-helix transcriptional regulator [Actinoplanes sandaracinus]MDI6098339.1 helix-turn-helix transcriptional regulator [Actinoplanes sandaracinus]
MSDNELGLFLRTRREALTPAEAGLPAGTRRRTPGLRRAEVAMLAGVSVEYLIRLEQGRDRRPSAQVLSALAGVLHLTPSERVHLHRLVKSADSGFLCRGDAGPGREVRPPVRALLDHLEPAAAVLINQLSDVLAWTSGFDRLARPVGLLDGTPPNLARYVFTDSRARSAFPDWRHVADEQVAGLKQGPFRADPHLAALADELTLLAGEEFSDRVGSVPGLARAAGTLRMAHPEAGALRLSYETLDLSADDDQRLMVYLPADETTTAALHRLTEPLRLIRAG